MPLYDIEHTTALLSNNPTLQQNLARSLTKLHATRFHTPSFFINVRFHDLSPPGSQNPMPTYRGGYPVRYNRILIRTRTSENRSKAAYDAHCRDVVAVWDDIIGAAAAVQSSSTPPQKTGGVEGKKDWELRTVWVMGALTTAVEAGFERPTAGSEVEWLKANLAGFRRLAEDDRDEEFVRLMEELRTREDFRGV